MMKKDQKFENRSVGFIEGGEGNTPLDGEFLKFSHEHSTAYSIDYLTFSFPFNLQGPLKSVQVTDPLLKNFLLLCHALNLRYDLIEDSFGTKGFANGYCWNVPVAYVGSKNPSTRFDYYLKQNGMKIGCFELSGACCRDFERRFSENHPDAEIDFAWYNLFSSILNVQGSPSRLDVAFDIFNPDEDHKFEYYMKKILGSEFSSPIGIVHPDYEFDDRLNVYKKQIITLGGEGSKVKICIYNKKLEREAQGLICQVDDWIRIEIRFYDEKAKNVMAELTHNWENRYEYLVGVLKHYLQIKIRPSCNDKAWNTRKLRQKWETDLYWSNLFEDVKKKKITNFYDKTPSVQSQKAYLYQNYNRFLLMLQLAMDHKNFDVYQNELFSKGFENLKPGDIERINYFRVKNGLKELTQEEILDRYQDVEIDKAKELEEHPEALEQLQQLEVKTRESLIKTFNAYQKNHHKKEFIREFEKMTGDNFDALTSEDLQKIFDTLILFFK